jgi:hypothetical protein
MRHLQRCPGLADATRTVKKYATTPCSLVKELENSLRVELQVLRRCYER